MNNLKIKFQIVTPERVLFDEAITQVTVPTTQGEITVLANHIPLVANLQPGVIEVIKENGERDIMYIAGGFLEVLKNKIVILADAAEHVSEIELAKVEAAKLQAEKSKENLTHLDHLEFANLNAVIAKELAKAKAIKRWKKVRNIE